MKEARARRDLERALASADAGGTSPETTAARLLAVEQEHPGTEAARRAAQMRPTYEGLSAARTLYPVRGCLDILQQLARSVEEYRQRSGGLPERLDSLGEQAVTPADPWGRPVRYRVSGTHYELSSLGSDGEPGGSAEAADLYVADGRIISGPAWAER